MEGILIIAAVTFILFLAAFVRSSLGFGDAVVAMPLLALVVDIKTATPVVALFATTIAISILLRNWQKTDLRATLHLVISSLLGIPLGLLIVKNLPEVILKVILGSIILLYGIYRFFKPGLKLKKDIPIVSFLFGFIAGILGGAYNTNGPPVVIYGTLRHWTPENFRATMQGYFLPTGLLITISHGVTGLWTSVVFKHYIVALPFVLLAVFLGGKFHHAAGAERFDRYVNSAIVLMGLLLILRVLFT
ncbi:sulfite exporter TauE/SafE family protein [Acidobacteriota bacterium]